MKDYLIDLLDDDDLEEMDDFELKDWDDDDDEEWIEYEPGLLHNHSNKSTQTQRKTHHFLTMNDEEVLASLVTPSSGHQTKNIIALIEALVGHDHAPLSLKFLSSQMDNFSWSATDLVRLGVAIEQQGEGRIELLLEQIFSPSSTIQADRFIQALVAQKHYLDLQLNMIAPKTTHALFEKLYKQDRVRELFVNNLPTDFTGLHFVWSKRKQYGRDVLTIDENRFQQLIVGLSFLPKKEWVVDGNSSWFLEAFSEVSRKGDRVYEIYKALKRRKDIDLDHVLNLLDDSDIALFSQKMMAEITPSLGQRVGAIMEKGVLTNETQSIYARKKM